MQIVNEFRDQFVRYLNEQGFNGRPKELYEPIDYIMQMGGKRLRPVLVLLGHHLFDDEVGRSLPVAYAVEMFHNFSLVHDDIMDEASIRRKQPTVHKKFGTNTGILAGDVMLVYVYHYLNRVADRSKLSTLLALFNEVAIKVCEGQQLDMNFERMDRVGLEEYLTMIELKTAVLIGGAVSMGATVAGADDEDVFHLTGFGRCVGTAFQLQDDLLDAYGSADKFGKRVGGDILQNKKTYLVTKAMEVADPASSEALSRFLNDQQMDPDEKIGAVLSIFDDLGIPQLTRAEKNAYQEQAMQHLGKVKAPGKRKKVLEELAAQLLERQV